MANQPPRSLDETLARVDALDDQLWADGVNWFRESNAVATLGLRGDIANDDPQPLIDKMQAHQDVAEIVQRLALLAFDEIIKRHIRRQLDESAE